MTSFASKEEEEEVITLIDVFKAYCRLDPISDGKNIDLLPLSQIDKWLEKAKILDMQKVTTTDTGMCYFKFRKRAITYEDFLQYIQELAYLKNLNVTEIKEKLESCPLPNHPQVKKK